MNAGIKKAVITYAHGKPVTIGYNGGMQVVRWSVQPDGYNILTLSWFGREPATKKKPKLAKRRKRS